MLRALGLFGFKRKRIQQLDHRPSSLKIPHNQLNWSANLETMTQDGVVPDIEKAEKKKAKKELGYERIRLALERLQLAWLRTAITFVALGFTSYRYYISRVEDGRETLGSFYNGRSIGLFLMVMAFIGLLQSTLQHRRSWAKLKHFYPNLPYSITVIQSYFVLAFTFSLVIMAWWRL
jgi:uncharacterized membrane protein YidH (DUF202 family)